MIDPKDIMCHASSIRVNGVWHGVLGYSAKDDVMCLENYTGRDIVIVDASGNIQRDDIRVEVNLQEALDKLFIMS